MPVSPTPLPFEVKDCALLSISEPHRAQNLRELRDAMTAVQINAIYNHFWGGLLRPRFDDPEYHNDFAAWAARALNDQPLAERLGIIDPAGFRTLEELRQEVIEVLEERLAESEFVPWAKADQQFHFVRSQLVVFDTGQRFTDPTQLAGAAPTLSLGSVFYHLIDARWRSPVNEDDFRSWLRGFGDRTRVLVERLGEVDPYFTGLDGLRAKLSAVLASAEGEG